MKCPKCGFTSFETNDSCSKCGNDLKSFRDGFRLEPIVMPAHLKEKLAAQYMDDSSEEETAVQDSGSDMFSFDLPQNNEAAAPAADKDPFDFSAPQPAPATEDPFASLMETGKPSTPQTQPTQQSGSGFELNSFSWDETPTPPAPGGAPAGQPQKPDDDFASLFGDLDGTKK